MRRGFRELVHETISFMKNEGKYSYSINEVAIGIKSSWRTSKNILETLHDLLWVRKVNKGKRSQYRLIERIVGKSGRRYAIRHSSLLNLKETHK